MYSVVHVTLDMHTQKCDKLTKEEKQDVNNTSLNKIT